MTDIFVNEKIQAESKPNRQSSVLITKTPTGWLITRRHSRSSGNYSGGVSSALSMINVEDKYHQIEPHMFLLNGEKINND